MSLSPSLSLRVAREERRTESGWERMPEEEGQPPPHGGKDRQAAAESAKTVYFVPIYALAVVDPSKHAAKRRISPEAPREKKTCSDGSVGARDLIAPGEGIRSKSAEPEANVHQHKKQKLILMRKRGKIPDYAEDDPHKPTPKRLRNRMKAQKSRDKKKAYMTALESKVDELEKMNLDLEEKCNAILIENESMKNKILDLDPAGKEKQLSRGDDVNQEKDYPLVERSVENLTNLVAESLDNYGGDGIPGRCSQINDLDCPGGGSTVEIQDCALDKFMCGSDAEGSPSRYIEDDDQFAHRIQIPSERFSL